VRESNHLARLWKANLLARATSWSPGDSAALEHIESIAGELGAMKVIRLAVSGAFHSPLMKPADLRLAEFLAGTQISAAAHSRLLERRRDAA